MGNFPNYYNLSNVDRPSNFHGSSLRIMDLTFNEKIEAIYRQGENIYITVSLSSLIDCQNLEFLFTISSRTNGVVGSMQTNSEKMSFSKDQKYKITFSLSTKQLAPDEYDMVLDLFVLNNHGEHLSYDHPSISFNFKIDRFKDYKGIFWEPNYYGNVVLEPAEVVSII